RCCEASAFSNWCAARSSIRLLRISYNHPLLLLEKEGIIAHFNSFTASTTAPTEIKLCVTSFDELQPNLDEQQPNVDKQQLNVDEQQLNVDEQQPDVDEQQPNVDEQQPNVDEQQPNVDEQQLNVDEQQPNVDELQPDVDRQTCFFMERIT